MGVAAMSRHQATVLLEEDIVLYTEQIAALDVIMQRSTFSDEDLETLEFAQGVMRQQRRNIKDLLLTMQS